MAGMHADVTVHVDEKLGHERLQDVADLVRKGDGVVSVDFHDDRPHFMLVQYDPGRTSAHEIHRIVVAQGVHAELIGM